MLDELSFDVLVAAVGVAAGAVASIAGFGVASLLTPLLTSALGGKAAVAVVSVPHALATLARLWQLRRDIEWRVMKTFGVASVAGGLTGALLFTQVKGEALARLLGVLLVAVGGVELAGVSRRLRIPPDWAWVAGAVSGLLGGMVGNQGGVRSAGLLGFGLAPRTFVATAAAIALMVDAVRVPIYVWSDGQSMRAASRVIVVATAGVIAGTFVGTGLLLRLPATVFRRAVGVVLLGLGVWMLR